MARKKKARPALDFLFADLFYLGNVVSLPSKAVDRKITFG